MDEPQHIIAVGQLFHNDPNGADIVNFRKIQILSVHLPVNAVHMLDPSLHLTGNAHAQQFFADALFHPLEEVLILLALVGHLAHDLPIAHRVQVLDGDVLQLPLDVLDAQTVGQRGIDLHGLQRLVPLLLLGKILECAGVVETVGQLDDDDPDVPGHGDEHLPQVLHLGLFLAAVNDLAQAGDAVDQIGHRAAELLFQRGICGAGVLQTVMEQTGHDGIGVHAQLSQDARHRHRMDEIGLAAAALLPLVGLLGKMIGLCDLLHIGKGRVLLHLFQQGLQAVIHLAQRLLAAFQFALKRGKAPVVPIHFTHIATTCSIPGICWLRPAVSVYGSR